MCCQRLRMAVSRGRAVGPLLFADPDHCTFSPVVATRNKARGPVAPEGPDEAAPPCTTPRPGRVCWHSLPNGARDLPRTGAVSASATGVAPQRPAARRDRTGALDTQGNAVIHHVRPNVLRGRGRKDNSKHTVQKSDICVLVSNVFKFPDVFVIRKRHTLDWQTWSAE